METDRQDDTGAVAAGAPVSTATRPKAPIGPRKQEKMNLILALHKQGKSTEEIRKAVNLSHATFHTYVTELGISAARKKVTRQQQLAEIRQMHTLGVKLEDIRENLGLTPQKFVFYLRILGIGHDESYTRMMIRDEIRALPEGDFDLNAMADRVGVTTAELVEHLKAISGS